MAAEGALAVAVMAGSVALLGFGLDSVVEGLASVSLVWRFTDARTTGSRLIYQLSGPGPQAHQAELIWQEIKDLYAERLADDGQRR